MRNRAWALSCLLALAPSIAALHLQGGTRIAVRSNLRLAGGSDTDAADALKEARLKTAGASGLGQERAEAGAENDEKNDWKAAAKRRAEQARSAGSHPREAIGKTMYRIFTSATNKLGLTGSSTRIVNGQVVVRRNIVQKLFQFIFIFFRAIFLFFKTLVVPLSTLEPQKKGGGMRP